jgi:Vitamin K-dependent gamma-carboxylase
METTMEISHTAPGYTAPGIGGILTRPRHIAPLAVLRMAFGLIMLISTIRFIAKGWVREFYIASKFFFPFYGFEWVHPLSATGMYIVFALMVLTTVGITLGLFYRASIITFFLCFTYVELLDKSYYLNHYYFVTLITFLLMLVPAHRYFSLDVWRRPSLKVTHVPAWMIDVFKAQLCLVYGFAGISKLNHDWLMEAMPLRLWLPANAGIPIFGHLLRQTWVAYAFSWFGAIFDLAIGPLLLYTRTRKIAYVFVILFHVLTGILFKIGMFPYIMIAVTIIFLIHPRADQSPIPFHLSARKTKILYPLLVIYVLLQLALPFRYLLYPGKLYWTEEGYRFSWRVMLMEKGGITFFYVKDPRTGRKGEVINTQFLTPLQERMMQTQPDMILQYAHYLHDIYDAKGIKDPVVTVESYVTLNGCGSRLYIDSTIDLARQHESFLPKKWVLPYQP